MGNTCTSRESGNVTNDVKQQGDDAQNPVYKLVDLNGGGEFVELTKKGRRTKDFSELDAKIVSDEFKSLLYNDGNGKKVPLIKILSERDNKDYTKESHSLKNKEKKEEILANGEGNYLYSKKDKQQYKDVCWKIDMRGTVGETILHLCFLNSSTIHADLAKRLIYHYPKLINDIYLGDMFYGESVLHIAIVNEDPALVKFLLDNGADVHQRCCGAFFCPADQKTSRQGHCDKEWFSVCKETNYEGHTYWGDSALCFAACLSQEECVRLLVAKGADPNFQDANGNTVLHLLVIYDRKDMFSLLQGLGARLDIKNQQDLTPLTLAAKLARKEIYEHILAIERQNYWIFGNVTCAGYPLEHIDTISSTGEINKNSALSLIVYGDREGHLDMMDGLVVYLLSEKWRTFIRFRFYRRLVIFLAYFLTFVLAFVLRPGTDLHPTVTTKNVTNNGNVTEVKEKIIDPCYLMKPYRGEDVARFILECIVYVASCTYILLALKEIYHQRLKIFLTTLKGAPTKALFLCSCIFVILMLPGRAACAYQYEDVMGVLAILCTAPYFLFFCRGFRIVGPFVVMIYNMIRGDLLRFFMIYAVFVIGFSQAMFIVFRGVDGSVFSYAIESMMGMFIMSLGEFGEIYDSFVETQYPDLGRGIPMLALESSPYFCAVDRGEWREARTTTLVEIVSFILIGTTFTAVDLRLMKQRVTNNKSSFYMAFLGVKKHTVFSSGIETMLALLTMATGEFEDFVAEFPESRHFDLLNVVFFVYMIMVTLLLVNMLIAMMGNTYQLINNTQKEWFRQWANIVLVIEQSVTTAHRQEKQLAYSQPMSGNASKRVLVSRWHQSEKEKELLKQKRDVEHFRDRNIWQKKKDVTTFTQDQNIDARLSHPTYTQH